MTGITIWTQTHGGSPKRRTKLVIDVVWLAILVVILSALQKARPAKSVWGGGDHFEKVCKTKRYARQVGMEPSGPQYDYAFSINEGDHSELTTVQIGGVDLKMLIDSGPTAILLTSGHGNSWRRREWSVSHRLHLQTKSCTHMHRISHYQWKEV